jgi:hypothetical protein
MSNLIHKKEVPMTTTTTINLSDEELFDGLTGACASFYSWYKDFQFSWYSEYDANTTPFVTVTMETGDETKAGVPTFATKRIKASLMRKTIERLIQEGQPTVCSVNWSDPECDSEIDANIADVVFQYIVLGDVVFG